MYDVLITGSDQVWTNLYAFNLVFFFDKLDNYKGKRISYAACSAHNKVPIYNKNKIKKLLLKFDFISVRDSTTKKLVKGLCGFDVPIVVDPTLLLDFTPYIKKVKENVPYIFCYILGDDPYGGHKVALDRIKKKYGNLKVITIASSNSSIRSYSDDFVETLSPLEWVNLIYHANFVYTDSFHAMIFSLKFEKDFVAYYSEIVRASRILALRDEFKLENLVVGSTFKIDMENISYDKGFVKYRIQEMNDFSLNFLRKSLEDR